MTDRTTFTCSSCGWESRPPAGVAVVFHPCRPTQSRRPLKPIDLPELEGITVDEAWATAFPGLRRDIRITHNGDASQFDARRADQSTPPPPPPPDTTSTHGSITNGHASTHRHEDTT